MKTSAARRPEAFLTNCHANSRLPLNFSHLSLRHQSGGASKHTFCRIHRKMELQLPFKPALRLRLFSNGLRARSFFSGLSSNYFLFGVSLKLLDSFLSLFSSGLFILCSIMPNFHCLRINLSLQFTSMMFGKIRSVFMSRDLGFCFCKQLFPCFSESDPDLTVVQLLVRFTPL